MTNTSTMTETLIRAADHAATQNDRWWVVTLFILLMLFVGVAGRWLIKKHETLIDQSRADQTTYSAQLAVITHEANATNQKLAVSLDRNTNALESNTEIVEKCRAELRVCRESIERRPGR